MVSNTIEKQCVISTILSCPGEQMPRICHSHSNSMGVDLLFLSNGRAETENKMLRQISGATREKRKLCNLHSLLNMVRIG
jgi:hypothetical protein